MKNFSVLSFFLVFFLTISTSFSQNIDKISENKLSKDEINYWYKLSNNTICKPDSPVSITIKEGEIIHIGEETCWSAINITLEADSKIVTNGYQFEIRANSLIANPGAKIVSFLPHDPKLIVSGKGDDGLGFQLGDMAPVGQNGQPGKAGQSGVSAAVPDGRTPTSIKISIESSAVGFLEITNVGENSPRNIYAGGEGGIGGRGQQGGRSTTKKKFGICTCATGPAHGGNGGDAGDGGDAGSIGVGGNGGDVHFIAASGASTDDFKLWLNLLGGRAGVGVPGNPGKTPGIPGLGGRGSCGCRGEEETRKGQPGKPGSFGLPSDYFRANSGDELFIPKLLCDINTQVGSHKIEGDDNSFFLGSEKIAPCSSFCSRKGSIGSSDPLKYKMLQTQSLWKWLGAQDRIGVDIKVRSELNKSFEPIVFIDNVREILANINTNFVIIPDLIEQYFDLGIADVYNHCSPKDKPLDSYLCCSGKTLYPTPNIECSTYVYNSKDSSTGVKPPISLITAQKGPLAAKLLTPYLIAKELARRSIRVESVKAEDKIFPGYESLIDWGNGIYTYATAETFQAIAYIVAAADSIDPSQALSCSSGNLLTTDHSFENKLQHRSAGYVSLGPHLNLIGLSGLMTNSDGKFPSNPDKIDYNYDFAQAYEIGSGIRISFSGLNASIGLSPVAQPKNILPDRGNLCHVFDRMVEATPTAALSCFIGGSISKFSTVETFRSMLQLPETGVLVGSLWYIMGN